MRAHPPCTEEQTIAICRQLVSEGIYPGEPAARKRDWYGTNRDLYRWRDEWVVRENVTLPKQKRKAAQPAVSPDEVQAATAEERQTKPPKLETQRSPAKARPYSPEPIDPIVAIRRDFKRAQYAAYLLGARI